MRGALAADICRALLAAEETGASPSNAYTYRQTDYAAVLRALAVSEGVAMLDGAGLWGGVDLVGSLVTAGAFSLADALHLTRSGGEAFAWDIYRALLDVE